MQLNNFATRNANSWWRAEQGWRTGAYSSRCFMRSPLPAHHRLSAVVYRKNRRCSGCDKKKTPARLNLSLYAFQDANPVPDFAGRETLLLSSHYATRLCHQCSTLESASKKDVTMMKTSGD